MNDAKNGYATALQMVPGYSMEGKKRLIVMLLPMHQQEESTSIFLNKCLITQLMNRTGCSFMQGLLPCMVHKKNFILLILAGTGHFGKWPSPWTSVLKKTQFYFQKDSSFLLKFILGIRLPYITMYIYPCRGAMYGT